MEGYDKANGDDRGILERFLPTIFRKTTDGSQTHNAILGALKKSIETTRDELATMSFEVYFTRATGKFLDLYGKYIGLARLPLEGDNSYRGRLLEYIKTQRGTISSIIKGIQSELGSDINVTVYETWRNIFILNQSTLNGLDYIMGSKYRYGVIEITLDTYVDNLVLQEVVNRYKAYGIGVYYRYSLGGTTNFWDMLVDNSGRYMLDGDTIQGSAPSVYFENKKTYLADSPITTADIALFKNNVSDLNGSDVVSGNPSNAYIYDKTKSPYYHLIGYVPNNVSVDSYTDIYDYVYKNNMVIPGGRNYVLNSSGKDATDSIRPTLKGSTSSLGSGYISYQSDGMTLSNPTTNLTHEWYYQVAAAWTNFSATPLTPGGTYTYSVDVKGTVPQAVLRWGFSGGAGGGGEKSTNFNINNTSWTRISITTSSVPTNTTLYFRVQGGINNQYATGFSGGETLRFRNVKIEDGPVATPWTPAPEDNDHSTDVYRFDTTPYLTLSKEDNNDYTFTPDTGSSTVFSFNMSRILANNGYNDQVKNFSSNQVGSVSIHTKGSEVGLPNTTISVVGNTGTPIAGSFNNSTKNLVINSEFRTNLDGWYVRGTQSLLSDGPKISIDGFGGSNSVVLDTTNGTGVGNVMYTSAAYPVEPSSIVSVSVELKSSIAGFYPQIGFIYYDSNMAAIAGMRGGVPVTTDYKLWKYTGTAIPTTARYVSFDILISSAYKARYVMSQPMMQIGSPVSDYEPGVNTINDIDGSDYVISNNSSGNYTYNLSTPSQVSKVTLDDYYSYGRTKRVITANGAGTEVSLGIFDTNTTPVITLPTDYKVLNKDTITRYVDGISVNTDVPLSSLRIYNYTTSNWDNIPTGEFKVDNYIKDAISIPGSYLLIKSVSANTFKYLDIDVTLLNLGVTQ